MARQKDRDLRRRQRRVQKLRHLKDRLAQTNDNKDRERLIEKINHILVYSTKDNPAKKP